MVVLGGAFKPLGLGSISILMVVEGATMPPGMEGCCRAGKGTRTGQLKIGRLKPRAWSIKITDCNQFKEDHMSKGTWQST